MSEIDAEGLAVAGKIIDEKQKDLGATVQFPPNPNYPVLSEETIVAQSEKQRSENIAAIIAKFETDIIAAAGPQLTPPSLVIVFGTAKGGIVHRSTNGNLYVAAMTLAQIVQRERNQQSKILRV
jgi:hypothetical protein